MAITCVLNRKEKYKTSRQITISKKALKGLVLSGQSITPILGYVLIVGDTIQFNNLFPLPLCLDHKIKITAMITTIGIIQSQQQLVFLRCGLHILVCESLMTIWAGCKDFRNVSLSTLQNNPTACAPGS